MQVRFGAPTFYNRLGSVGGAKGRFPNPAKEWRERAAACGFKHDDEPLPAEIVAAEAQLAELADAGTPRDLTPEELLAIRRKHGFGWLIDMMAAEKGK